jgi:CRP-like cAMP-binding protein
MQNQDLFNRTEEYQSFAPGRIIFQEGEPGDNLYVVAEGQVDLVVGDRILETVGPGSILGELAMIDDKPRSASAIARTACQLVPVTRQHFLALIQRRPAFALQVMRVMADRLRRTTSQLRQ